MPEEQWRDEFQEYGLLLQAVASGDRSKALKLFGDYLLNQSKSDPVAGPSAPGQAQGQDKRQQEADQDPDEEENLDVGDEAYDEEEEYLDEGQYEDYGEEEYPAVEDEEYSAPKPRKKVRFADEEGANPLEENEPEQPDDNYGYDEEDHAYYDGEYDPGTYDDTYDGEPYMSGALAEDNGNEDEYYLEPYDEGYAVEGDLNDTAPARKPAIVNAFPNYRGYTPQTYDEYNQGQPASTDYSQHAYPGQYGQEYYDQNAAGVIGDTESYYNGTEAGYAYAHGTEPGLAESGGEWQHHFPQHDLGANDEEQALGLDEFETGSHPPTNGFTQLGNEIDHIDPGYNPREEGISQSSFTPSASIDQGVQPSLEYGNYPHQMGPSDLEGTTIDHALDNDTDQATLMYDKDEMAAPTFINPQQGFESSNPDPQHELDPQTERKLEENDNDGGGVHLYLSEAENIAQAFQPAAGILPKRRAVGVDSQNISRPGYSPGAQKEVDTSEGSPTDTGDPNQAFNEHADTGPNYNLEELIPNIERPRKEEPWVPELPEEEAEEYQEDEEPEYMSNNPLRHIYEAEKNESNAVRPYFDEAPLPFDLSQDYWEEPWDGELYASSLYYDEDQPEADYDSTAEYYIDPHYNVFEEGSRFYSHYNDWANESQLQRNPSTRSGSSKKSAMNPRALFGRIRERLV